MNAKTLEFKNLLLEYGEEGLLMYHKAFHHYEPSLALRRYIDQSGKTAALEKMYSIAREDMYCWVTMFAILKKVSFLGSIVSVSRATSMEELDLTRNTEHYTNLGICRALRGKMGNVFGDSEKVTTGTKLFLNLVRHRCHKKGVLKYEHFKIVPYGDKLFMRPPQNITTFQDYRGMLVGGHSWSVGVVVQPGTYSPNKTAVDGAANVGWQKSERLAYENHGSLPELEVLIGFK